MITLLVLGFALWSAPPSPPTCDPMDAAKCIADIGALAGSSQKLIWSWVGSAPARSSEEGRPRLTFESQGPSGILVTPDINDVLGKWIIFSTESRLTSGELIGPRFDIVANANWRFEEPDAAHPICTSEDGGWQKCNVALYVPQSSTRVYLTVGGKGAFQIRSLHLEIRDGTQMGAVASTDRAAFEHASGIMQKKFFKTDVVNWATLESESAPWLASPGHNGGELAVAWLAFRLPSHGHTRVIETKVSGADASGASLSAREGPRAGSGPIGRMPLGKLGSDRLGYLRLPTTPGPFDNAAHVVYWRQAQREILDIAAHGAHDWVIDLRGNEGGSIFTLLASLAPLIGVRHDLGAFKSRTGNAQWFGIQQKGVVLDNELVAPVVLTQHIERPGTITLLVDQHCASSCEMLASVLAPLPNVRVAGLPTTGVPTGNGVEAVTAAYAIELTEYVLVLPSGKEVDGPIRPNYLLTDDELRTFEQLSGPIRQKLTLEDAEKSTRSP